PLHFPTHFPGVLRRPPSPCTTRARARAPESTQHPAIPSCRGLSSQVHRRFIPRTPREHELKHNHCVLHSHPCFLNTSPSILPPRGRAVEPTVPVASSLR